MSQRHRQREGKRNLKGDGGVVVEQFKDDGTFVPCDPANPLAKFTAIEQDIINLKFKNRQLNQSEIAKLLGISIFTMSKHFKRQELAAVCAYLERDVYDKVKTIQQKSVEVLEKMLDDPKTDQVVKCRIAMFFAEPIVQSGLALPPVPEIENLAFVDTSQGAPQIEYIAPGGTP